MRRTWAACSRHLRWGPSDPSSRPSSPRRARRSAGRTGTRRRAGRSRGRTSWPRCRTAAWPIRRAPFRGRASHPARRSPASLRRRRLAWWSSVSWSPFPSHVEHGPDPQVTYNDMVVDEVPNEVVDEVFRALADSTRRDILRRCAADEPSVSRLAQAYPMSFAAVQKHVAVLERAGQALDALEATWRGLVERMSNLLATGGTE